MVGCEIDSTCNPTHHLITDTMISNGTEQLFARYGNAYESINKFKFITSQT